MARSNNKTTMAKLNRETKLRERRFEKQVRKDARKRAAAEGRDPSQPTSVEGVADVAGDVEVPVEEQA